MLLSLLGWHLKSVLCPNPCCTVNSSVNRAFFITAHCREGAIVSNFAWSENPRGGHVRHVVLRRRKTLEDAGVLEKIAVEIHPDPEAPAGTYPSVTFLGRGLMTNRPFKLAYEAAKAFIEILSKRTTRQGVRSNRWPRSKQIRVGQLIE